jgi:RNA ligase (TIGR02306 family)
MRKLASIQTISEILPAPGFDNLVIAKVLGWHALVKKDEFKPGDKCIYVEYDSVMPEIEEFEFLRSRKFRIKTMKMRGTISQGLILHRYVLAKLVPDITADDVDYSFQVGDDVTELLGITKYEIPEDCRIGFGRVRNWPDWLPKTDETRLQGIPNVLDELSDYYVTIKEDGSSASYYLKDDHFGVCSRNMESDEPDEKNAYWKCAVQYDIEKKLRKVYETTGRQFAIQGEIAGPGMNGSGVYKNPIGYDALNFHIFNIYDIDQIKYVDYLDMQYFCNLLELSMVNVIEVGNKKRTVDEWIEFATTHKYKSGKPVEGIVIRPLKETYSMATKGRLSFKVINNLYLLAEK